MKKDVPETYKTKDNKKARLIQPLQQTTALDTKIRVIKNKSNVELSCSKMKDAELIGVPINVIIGKQYLQNNEIELKHRDGQSSTGKVEDILTIFEHYKSS